MATPHAEKHQFAFYMPDLAQSLSSQKIIITNPLLIQRIKTILRLEVGEQVILFDEQHHIVAALEQFDKNKKIICAFVNKATHSPLQPDIKVLLPLLKKESLETALYTLTEIGVNQIQLILSEKSQQRWTDKDHERGYKIMIAAAEQSKNFALPKLEYPLALKTAIPKKENGSKVVLDKDGICFFDTVNSLKNNEPVTITLGPEGDFTQSEKQLLADFHFQPASLTTTILRSWTAAFLACGIIRTRFCKQ